jgi:AcrR family transcriptional regulator
MPKAAASNSGDRLDGRRADARGTAREKLLDSAVKVFAERGYRGTSVDLVAADAGVTKGALYWHFKDKEELLVALIDERVDRRIRDLSTITETAAKDETTAATVSAGLSALIDEQRRLMLLTHEYWSLAVRDPELRSRYVTRQRALRDAVSIALVSRHRTTGVPLNYPADRLATAIMALGNGLAMERIADPEETPPELFGEILDMLYDGLVYRAQVEPAEEAGSL